ncbi:MAG: hypothetical protein ACLTV1_00875 [Christensenellales bacterium]
MKILVLTKRTLIIVAVVLLLIITVIILLFELLPPNAVRAAAQAWRVRGGNDESGGTGRQNASLPSDSVERKGPYKKIALTGVDAAWEADTNGFTFGTLDNIYIRATFFPLRLSLGR